MNQCVHTPIRCFYQNTQQNQSHIGTHGLINLPKDQKQASIKQTNGKLFNVS